MKIRPVGAQLFHANGRTDITKLTVAFRDFSSTHKKVDGEILYWTAMKIPHILESNPHPFYSFRGLKNQMRIRIAVESWILEK